MIGSLFRIQAVNFIIIFDHDVLNPVLVPEWYSGTILNWTQGFAYIIIRTGTSDEFGYQPASLIINWNFLENIHLH